MKGSDGSLDKTLVDAGSSDTVAAPTSGASTTPRSTAPAEPLSLARYELGESIGRGGMGEVIAARDPKIGRALAVKRMHAATSDEAVARFLREAKIQARLDHPAIVPVYDLGTDRDGKPYFTMKRLAGTTLAHMLAAGDHGLNELLRAFVDVCRAIDFAHDRGVVHRDLKPSNVMLGDFGEVYVLDWGIARVVGDRESSAGAPGDITTLEGQTQVGALLGTPGYMAPEQARGDAELGPPADVYALGCILFEILAGEAVHPRGGSAALASTLTPTVALAPSARCPERAIAPELDAACVSALAGDPAARPRVRALADRVQAYLDGDRDVERRRKLAAEHLARAKGALATGDRERRGDAMQEAGHALVLDPESTDAAALVMQLSLEPPPELPDELERELAAIDDDQSLAAARFSAIGYLAFFTILPFVLWGGDTDRGFIAVMIGLILANAAYMFWTYRSRRVIPAPAVVGSMALIVLVGRFAGPFVITPALVVVMTMGMANESRIMRRPWLTIGAVCAAWLVPWLLEETGWLERTWTVGADGLTLHSTSLHLDDWRAPVTIGVATLVTIIASGVFARALATARRNAQRAHAIQAWHLRKLLPVAPPPARAPQPGCVLL
jgi:serine/threonine-protein kinase